MEKEKLTALVEKAKSGNPNAIEDLLCQAHISVSYQCRKMLPNVQDAEDLTQEILLTVYQKLHTLQEPAAFWGWLSRITATRCMNAISRTHVDLQFAEDEDGNSVLDIILTEKKLRCEYNHINMTCIADGICLDTLSTGEICSLFGNIIDNAIEAVSQNQDETKRTISLTVRPQRKHNAL